MTPKGFQLLTEDEQYFIDCFEFNDEFIYPEFAFDGLWSGQYLREIINSLKKKQLIKGKFPLRLTTAGKRFLRRNKK